MALLVRTTDVARAGIASCSRWIAVRLTYLNLLALSGASSA
jgi:hypothetical protein